MVAPRVPNFKQKIISRKTKQDETDHFSEFRLFRGTKNLRNSVPEFFSLQCLRNFVLLRTFFRAFQPLKYTKFRFEVGGGVGEGEEMGG